MDKPRVLICDDHALIVEGLRSVLADEFDVIGVCANGRDLVDKAEDLQPDAVLVDVSLPVLNGMEAARRIKSISPAIKIVFVTQRSDSEYVQTAFRLGASAYILKQSAAGEVIPALREALAGRYYLTPSLFNGVPEALINPNHNPAELFGGRLTGRQREVLQLVAEGKSNKEIAGVLNISLKTVDFHKARIMDELGLRSTAELTRYAIEHGMVGA
ncbi:MAG: response regulator transcription factor [Acidobacteriaceae bacterium]|nr:response regulator transcription factor [Acidobacteriaceae bacterium]